LAKEGGQRPDWQEIILEEKFSKNLVSVEVSVRVVIENGILCRKWNTPDLRNHVF